RVSQRARRGGSYVPTRYFIQQGGIESAWRLTRLISRWPPTSSVRTLRPLQVASQNKPREGTETRRIFPTAPRHSFFLAALWVEGMSEECEQSRCSGRAAEDGSQVRP